MFYTQELPKNAEGKFGEYTNNKICRAFKKRSSCYAGFVRCPESMRRNFTRREEGYRAFRSVVCDKEAYEGAITTIVCSDVDKMQACLQEQHGHLNASNAEYEQIVCGYNQAQSVCYKKSWISSCGMSFESARAVVTTLMEAADLLHDCERRTGAAAEPSVILTLVMEHLPLKVCNEVARTGHTLCDHRQPLRSCGVCRQKNVGISAEQRRMSELRSVGGRMITFAAALVLSFSVVTASKE
ncbi:hypothetical protein V5799_012117, partial [Amblyomma americanum]